MNGQTTTVPVAWRLHKYDRLKISHPERLVTGQGKMLYFFHVGLILIIKNHTPYRNYNVVALMTQSVSHVVRSVNQPINPGFFTYKRLLREVRWSPVWEIIRKRIWWTDEFRVTEGRWITTLQTSCRLAGRSTSVGRQPASPVGWRRLTGGIASRLAVAERRSRRPGTSAT